MKLQSEFRILLWINKPVNEKRFPISVGIFVSALYLMLIAKQISCAIVGCEAFNPVNAVRRPISVGKVSSLFDPTLRY